MSPTKTPPSSCSRSVFDQAITSDRIFSVRKMCKSLGWMTPLASTRFVLSAVGISFSAGWTYSSPVVISMPSSAIALLDDQDVVVGRTGAGLRTELRRGGRPRGRVVVDDQDILFGRLHDRGRLLQRRRRGRRALPRRIGGEPDDVVPDRLRHPVAEIARVEREIELRLRLAPPSRGIVVGALGLVVRVPDHVPQHLALLGQP